jgi:hypothetical protein
MKNKSWRKFLRGASLQKDVGQIKELVMRYVREETVAPIKALGRFVLWGVIGSLFVGFGAVMLLLGCLRLLQEQFKVLDGSLSWIPYLAVVLLGFLIISVTFWRITSGAAKRRLSK